MVYQCKAPCSWGTASEFFFFAVISLYDRQISTEQKQACELTSQYVVHVALSSGIVRGVFGESGVPGKVEKSGQCYLVDNISVADSRECPALPIKKVYLYGIKD